MIEAGVIVTYLVIVSIILKYPNSAKRSRYLVVCKEVPM